VKGGEEVYLGLVDKAHGASLRLSSNTYLSGGLTTDWQQIQIPLKDFPKQGTKWDEKTQQNQTFDFDWTQVSEVLIDNNGPDHNNATVFLDDVVVKPEP
jgi:putative lipase involved disintegration of autophagic bodies